MKILFRPQILACYFVAGSQDCRHLGKDPETNLLTILEQALKAGITCYQFREKGAGAISDPDQIKQLAQKCRDLCHQYQVPFIVNNDVDLAIELNADGVHVGQDDEPIDSVIQRFSHLGFIGLSCQTLTLAKEANQLEALDYIGVGPIFTTSTKTDAGHAKGPQLLAAIRQAGLQKPMVAIGGITTQNAQQLWRYSIDGIAVVSAITQAEDVVQVCSLLINGQMTERF